MLMIAAAAALASVPTSQPIRSAAVSTQARATVRIISAVTVRLGEGAVQGEAPPAQATMVRADGSQKPARLVEFQ